MGHWYKAMQSQAGHGCRGDQSCRGGQCREAYTGGDRRLRCRKANGYCVHQHYDRDRGRWELDRDAAPRCRNRRDLPAGEDTYEKDFEIR